MAEINKYFRNHHGPRALRANQKGSIKPQLHVVTRWNSQLKCIQTYLTNRPFLLIILAHNKDVIETPIANLINNIGLYREVKYLYDQLQPIAISLYKLQGDESNIADSCEEWLNLLELVQLSNHHTNIQQRFHQAITPIHYLANILYPKYMGQRLTCEQQQEARSILVDQSSSLLPQLY